MENKEFNLSDFAEELIKDSGFDNLEEDFKNDMRDQISAEAGKRIGMMVISQMDEEDLKKYQSVLVRNHEDQNSEEVQKFIKETIPQLAERIILTLKSYREEFISTAKSVKK